MSVDRIELRRTLSTQLLDVIEVLVDEAVREQLAAHTSTNGSSPYMTVTEAAEYLRASKQRVYDLLSAGRLTRRKDGTRVLVSREELEAHLAGNS